MASEGLWWRWRPRSRVPGRARGLQGIDAKQDEHGTWQARSPDLRPLLESNPRVEPLMREVIVRLLSDAPDARGTAAQVAQALEAGANGEEAPASSMPPVRTRAWKPWLALAAAGACAAAGDTSPTEPQAATASPEEKKPLAQQPLPLPRPGQARPDEKGRCLGLRQVPINGGCWVEQLSVSADACVENGYVPFQGKCYLPAPAPPKRPAPTSSPGQER